GEFHVPMGRYGRGKDVRDFSAYRDLLSSWQFSSGDFEQLGTEPGDFIYADPPFDVEFRKYAKEGFDWEDQERTATWLAAHPGPVVLVNQATPRIRKLYRRLGFQLDFLSAPRRINSTGDRTAAREVVATRNLTRASASGGFRRSSDI